jgi:hypothetical protein
LHSNARRISLVKVAAVGIGASLTVGLGAATPAVASAPTLVAVKQVAKTKHLSAKQRNEAIARTLVAKRHWSTRQYKCLVKLWDRESNWNDRANNPWSGAYGIPQALPGRKMASAGPRWWSNPTTQIKWGLRYIKGRYGTPCGAWAHSERDGWY